MVDAYTPYRYPMSAVLSVSTSTLPVAYPAWIPYTVPANALSVISMSISPSTLLCNAPCIWETLQSPDMLIFMDPTASDEYKHVAAETFDPLFTVIETAGSEPVLAYSMAPL